MTDAQVAQPSEVIVTSRFIGDCLGNNPDGSLEAEPVLIDQIPTYRLVRRGTLEVFLDDGAKVVCFPGIRQYEACSFGDDIVDLLSGLKDGVFDAVLKRAVRQAEQGGPDQMTDWASDAAFAYRELSCRNLEDALRYADFSVDLEIRNGLDSRVRYDQAVEIGIKGGLQLKDSNTFGLAVVSGNLEIAGSILAESYDWPKNLVPAFSHHYEYAVKKYGLMDATVVLVPAYVLAAQIASRYRSETTLQKIAEHVDPAVDMVKDKPETFVKLDDLVKYSLYPLIANADAEPKKRWEFAQAWDRYTTQCGEDIGQRWADGTMGYCVKGKLGLDAAMQLSDGLETYVREQDVDYHQAKDRLDGYLRLQDGSVADEGQLVKNTLGALRSQRVDPGDNTDNGPVVLVVVNHPDGSSGFPGDVRPVPQGYTVVTVPLPDSSKDN